MNPFTASETAAAYAQGRPYFHPLVIETVKAKLALAAPVELAVDVACGTDLSARALLAIAEQVIATDISEGTLLQAPRRTHISYQQAPAESLPLADASADLITVSSAFHWFERDTFLLEARRVLRPGGWLVIYDNAFNEQTCLNAEFVRWFEDYYTAHPSPPRNCAPFADENAQRAGFEFLARETYENTWLFGLSGFVAYLMSQSNAVAAVARGDDAAARLSLKLTENLTPFFAAGKMTLPFAGLIWILRRP